MRKADEKTGIALPAGQQRIGTFDSSTSHDLAASIAMPSGQLPFGWTVSGGYSREDASELDQRYVGKNVRADVVVPVAPTLALTGGAGYEAIRISERARCCAMPPACRWSAITATMSATRASHACFPMTNPA